MTLACEIGMTADVGQAKGCCSFIIRFTLEDPQYLHHVLTMAVGPKLFYSLPELSARFMRKIALHQECMDIRLNHQPFLNVNVFPCLASQLVHQRV